MLPPIATIVENFEFIDDDYMQLEYLIELGRALEPMPEALRTEQNSVRGCESQVWIHTSLRQDGPTPRMVLQGFSDSLIVCGFVALMIALYSGKTPREAAETDGFDLLRQLRFGAHVTSKRSNGVRAMVDRIHRDAVRLSAEAA
jgi:cysteine desulfuration protein SufE